MAKSKNASGVQSVERALDVLEALAQADGALGLTTLIQETGLPLATVHRLLTTLAARGYIRQDPESRRYLLGPSVLKLREPYTRLFGVWAQRHLAELADVSQETANLAVLDGSHVVYIAQVGAPQRRLRMFTHVGNRVLPHSSAVGKVLLAFTPREEAERIIERTGLPRRTAATITEWEHFATELDTVARQGYAVDAGEEEEAVRCIAVPVFVVGQPVAAISVSGPAARLETRQQDRLLAEMTRIAAALSASLRAGHTDDEALDQLKSVHT
ncbi:IclR family transcriptional regulator [Phytoactinopolyspora halophila]|uniref:IclR family transcriptional regulator n=1 Tax=Phytoactinopolyspora halophila TaxID=1981511 RepID=UPI001FEAF0D4|nr:IclR family transcriptional regulator [Phytoactinopolyspora halophila]